MTTVLCVGTCGASQPARATFSLAAALVATGLGNQAQIVLMGDGTQLMKNTVSGRIQVPDWPPLGELLQRIVAHAIPIYV